METDESIPEVQPNREQLKEERKIATRLLIQDINRLRTKVDVISEPYLEAKGAMGLFTDKVIPVLQDYERLQRESESLRVANERLKRENETLKERVKVIEKKEKEEKDVGGNTKRAETAKE